MSQIILNSSPQLQKCLHFLSFCFIFYVTHVVTQPELPAHNETPLLVENSQWNSFERMFTEKLRGQFGSCMSAKDEGERGVCELLAATDTQASIVQESGENSAKPEAFTHSCPYREEGGPDLYLHAAQRQPQLQKLLESYTKMHRHCVSTEHSKLKEIYQKRTTSECRYIVWSCTFGLGNKLMSLVSTFLYALLSQRVLLVDNADWESLFCEPFLNSRWIVPAGFSLKDDESPSFSQFHDLGCTSGTRHHHPQCSSHVLSVVFSATTNPSEHRFLVCPTAIASIRNVKILNFRNSNQYFAAGFFLNPTLRPVLENLFPQHNVFHLLSRFLLNPSQPVWQKVKIFHAMHLSNSTRRIGVQLRESKGEYRDYYDMAAPLCIRAKSGLCPIELAEAKKMLKNNNLSFVAALDSQDYISVYVSSLAGGHFPQLKISLTKIEQETGQRYRIFAQGADGEQLEDVGHLQKALIDIWLLSMSDVLMTSHMSTFGYTAQGLAGITPYHLKPWPENPCWPSVSSDPCFHFGPKKVRCHRDKFVMRNPLQEVNYMRSCPDLPDTGLQLSES